MNNHSRKKIAPIVITVLMLVYFILYFSVLISLIPVLVIRILLGIIPLCLGAGMIGVCVQRMKEIDGGEEDDLSKY